MKKAELLSALQNGLTDGTITKHDVQKLLQARVQHQGSWNFSISNALYAIGALVVIVGLVALVAQIWDDLGTIARIGVTFVLALVFSGIGSMLFIQSKQTLGAVFHIIGGALLPLGIIVLFDETLSSQASIWLYVTAYACTTGLYLILTFFHKHAILTLLSIIHATTLLYITTNALLQNISGYSYDDIVFTYLTMVIGVSYLLLAQQFTNTWNRGLLRILHFFGANFVIWSAFLRLTDDGGAWLILFVPLVGLGMYIANIRKSIGIQVVSTIGLLAYLTYITSEYFANSIGWPVSLIVLGFVCIGVAYGSVLYTKQWVK